MKLINKLWQILGLFTSVFIVFSVFLSYISLDVLEYSIFSWSLFELNKKVAIAIIVLAALAFLFAYAQKGFLVSLLGIIIFVVNIYIFNNLSTGIEKLDEVVYMLESFLGEIFTPGFGFIFVAAGSVVLFFSGVLLNKEKDYLSYYQCTIMWNVDEFKFFSYYDGFFDQYNEYCYFKQNYDDDGIFEWVTLPEVIGREYYTKQN